MNNEQQWQGWQDPEYRYLHDAAFHQLVDMMEPLFIEQTIRHLRCVRLHCWPAFITNTHE